MNYLNLGCGYRFDQDWTNVNFAPTGKGVLVYDLRRGIPFADNSFDVVYHSHLLEHFSKVDALVFLHECYRVLQSGGILRVVVPDLERIVKAYLSALECALSGTQEEKANYDWIMLELYDQTVRNYSGGEIATYLSSPAFVNENFILKRGDIEIRRIVSGGSPHVHFPSGKPLRETFREGLIQIREWLFRLFLRHEYHTLQLGRFRQSGEVHQWMYDRYSLSALLKQCGFQDITQQTAMQSCIPDWVTFHLDSEPDGTPYKPESLYMETRKPVSTQSKNLI